MNDVYSWKLSKSTLMVLSELYNKDFELTKTIKEYNPRMTVLFSKKTKEEMIKSLGISYNTFHNCLSKLNKKGLTTKNTINEKLLFDLEKEQISLTITFIDLNKENKDVNKENK